MTIFLILTPILSRSICLMVWITIRQPELDQSHAYWHWYPRSSANMSACKTMNEWEGWNIKEYVIDNLKVSWIINMGLRLVWILGLWVMVKMTFKFGLGDWRLSMSCCINW
jgi:hypothetical protein